MIYFRWPGRDAWLTGGLRDVFRHIALPKEECGIIEQVESTAENTARMLGVVVEMLMEVNAFTEEEVFERFRVAGLIDDEYMTRREPEEGVAIPRDDEIDFEDLDPPL